jgi:NADH-quinone oxidoreductase subunit L
MTVPLLVLAVFAALIGLSFLPLSSFAEFIGRTPALSSLYLGSHELEFHMDAAVTSTVVVLFGIGLSAYLYLGGARQANMLVQLFNAPWYQRMFDVNSMAVLQDKLWIQKVKRRTDSWRLGWLAAFVGRLLLLVGLVIAAPLILLGFASPYRLSQKKFFFDELYQFCVIKPLQLCAKLLYAIDHHCIDGLVNLLGRLPVWLGGLMRPLQMGLIPFYALSMVLGVLVLILARLLWLPL